MSSELFDTSFSSQVDKHHCRIWFLMQADVSLSLDTFRIVFVRLLEGKNE